MQKMDMIQVPPGHAHKQLCFLLQCRKEVGGRDRDDRSAAQAPWAPDLARRLFKAVAAALIFRPL